MSEKGPYFLNKVMCMLCDNILNEFASTVKNNPCFLLNSKRQGSSPKEISYVLCQNILNKLSSKVNIKLISIEIEKICIFH